MYPNNYSIGGGVRGYQQFLVLNGTNVTLQNNGNQGTWSFAPNIDALQVVDVLAPTYDGRYGRTGGGTVSMVTKASALTNFMEMLMNISKTAI